ncbi:MAG TPA: class I SAM-dependent methyltransferase [Phenylobacterium sp.]|nr:class I SAM-dependent methyltransferase [Phenylobacterium sp.]
MSEPLFAGPHEAQLRQGMAWLQEHLLNHAEIIFGQVLAAAPDHPLALRMRGVALFKLGRRDEAIAALTAAAERDAGQPRAWSDLAVALRDAGRAEDAARAYARGIAAQSAGAGPAPPLAGQVFSSDRARHAVTVVDYPYRAEIRYGAGRPAHPELAALIGAGRERYRDTLSRLGEMQADFAQVPLGGTYDTPQPFWLNAWFPPLDAMALTGMLRQHDPARFVEIGSGVSTKFARRAVSAYGLRTRLTSIDPQPRNEIDGLCDQVIRTPLEQCDPQMFQALEPGDIFFLDSSHRAFQGSDVTVFFLEILPRLKPGVIVHVHDIYLPDDYISGHVRRLWNEQYLLATALLFGPDRFEILFPSWFVGRDPDLAAHAEALLRQGPLSGLGLYGASFWMRIR